MSGKLIEFCCFLLALIALIYYEYKQNVKRQELLDEIKNNQDKIQKQLDDLIAKKKN